MILKHALYVITGANRGFGRAIAECVARSATDKTTVVLLGRQAQQLENVSQQLPKGDRVTVHIIGDAALDSATLIEDTVFPRLNDLIKSTPLPFTRAVLINNAGSTGDLSKQISEYTSQEIQSYFSFNVASYTAMVSGFIRLFNQENGPFPPEMTIVNISSLLAVEPFANWGLYASGKAARDMLLRVLAKEQPSVKALSYAPGPLDNEMQRQVRETLGDAKQKKLYSDMAERGELVNMEKSAQKLVDLLEQGKFESGAHIDFYDP